MTTQQDADRFSVEPGGDMNVQLTDRKLLNGDNLEILGRIFDQCHCRRLALDFRAVHSLAPVALKKLIDLNRAIERAGGRLILTHLNAALRNVFESTRLAALFEIEDPEEDLRAFRSLYYAETGTSLAKGSRTVNVLPSPNLLRAATLPPKA